MALKTEVKGETVDLNAQKLSQYNWRIETGIPNHPNFGFVVNVNQNDRNATITSYRSLFTSPEVMIGGKITSLPEKKQEPGKEEPPTIVNPPITVTPITITTPSSRTYVGQSMAIENYGIKLETVSVPYAEGPSKASIRVYDSSGAIINTLQFGANSNGEVILPNKDLLVVSVGEVLAGLTPLDSWANLSAVIYKHEEKPKEGMNRLYQGGSITLGQAESTYAVKLTTVTVPYGNTASSAVFDLVDKGGNKVGNLTGASGQTVQTKLQNGDVITLTVREVLAGLTPLDSWAEVTGSVSKASMVSQAISTPSQNDVKKYFAKLNGKELGAGVAITGPKTSIELLAVLRKRLETVSGDLVSLDKVSNEVTWRFALGYDAKNLGAKIIADKEKQEMSFRGSIGKTGLNLIYAHSNIKGEWTKWIENTTNIEVSQGLLNSKKTDLRLGIRYTGYNNTVSIQDAANKETKDLVGPTAHIIFTPSKALKLRANMGGMFTNGDVSGLDAGIGITYKNLKADLSTETANEFKKTAFTVGYKF